MNMKKRFDSMMHPIYKGEIKFKNYKNVKDIK
jgi:hypothetical protein